MSADKYGHSVTAIRGKREGADNWELSDALNAAIPQGSPRAWFGEVRVAAERAGVKPYAEVTLRIYRDTAARFPIGERIPGVSFTAHRDALGAADPGALLRDLANRLGAENVTTGDVKREIAATAPSAPVVVSPAVAPTLAEVGVSDLAAELAARYNADPNAAVADLGKTPASVLTIAALIRATEQRATARTRKANQWAATPTSAPAKTSAPGNGKVIKGNVR